MQAQFDRVTARILGTAGAVLLLAACGGNTGNVAPQELTVFPPAPETPRIQFLTTFRDSRDVRERKDQSGVLSFLLGSKDEKEVIDPILKPYGVAVHNGTVYVCDTVAGGVDVLDLRNRTFEYFRPTGFGRLVSPINCFVDPADGALYVTDTGRRLVMVYDSTGVFRGSIGDTASVRPVDVVVQGESVWVSDLEGRRVLRYDKGTGRLIQSFPDGDVRSREFLNQPTNIAVTSDRVYVSDMAGYSVKVFSHDGELIDLIGSYGMGPGQFHRPKGVAVDREGNLYVVDAAFGNLQMFDSEGQLLLFFPENPARPGGLELPAKVVIDYENISYFQEYVRPGWEIEYLILVTGQWGPNKVNVYGFLKQSSVTAEAQ